MNIRIQGKTSAEEYAIRSVTLQWNGATYTLKSSSGKTGTGRAIRGFFETTLADAVIEPVTPDAPAFELSEIKQAKPTDVDAELTGASGGPFSMEVLACWTVTEKPAAPSNRKDESTSFWGSKQAVAPTSTSQRGRRSASATGRTLLDRSQPITPPEPWRTHRDDFLCTPRTPEIDAKEQAFEKQVALLAETVTPVDYDDILFRSLGPDVGKIAGASGEIDAYMKYMARAHMYYSAGPQGRIRNPGDITAPLFELVCFRADKERTAFPHAFSDLTQVPFQGIGGFGLAIVPSRIKRSDVTTAITKVLLSQFLGIAPLDLEYIVVVRASKLNLKRVDDLKAAGVPVVFDFSGRTQSSKQALDPLAGMIRTAKRAWNLEYAGRLTEEQAAKIDGTLDAEKFTRMVFALQDAAYGRDDGFSSSLLWSFEMVSTLTFGREPVPDSIEEIDTHLNPLAYSRRRQFNKDLPWPLHYATFPPETIPTNDSAKAIKRMRDVGTIWRKALERSGLQILENHLMRSQIKEKMKFDRANLQDIGTYLGIDAMIESLYNGVPIDYII